MGESGVCVLLSYFGFSEIVVLLFDCRCFESVDDL